jgi:hypothetical protein
MSDRVSRAMSREQYAEGRIDTMPRWIEAD